MKETRLTLPEVALIAGTRAIGGAGIGLLLANRLSESQRRAVGWTLFLVGALTTVPLVFEVFGKRQTLSRIETNAMSNAPSAETGERTEPVNALART